MSSTRASTTQRTARSRRTSRRASIPRSQAEPFSSRRSGNEFDGVEARGRGRAGDLDDPLDGVELKGLGRGLDPKAVEAELAGILLSQARRFKSSADRAIARVADPTPTNARATDATPTEGA
jgi:hypothetical protein